MTDNAALKRIAEKLRRAGANLPAPELSGTIEGSVVTGLCIALALVESEIEALADPMREVQRLGQEIEQEPVAWKLLGSAHFRKTLPKNTDVTNWSPLYSAPQRSWVGLSEKKQWEIARNISCFDWGELMSETEQALKELNT
jgi:hypothetical protein